MPTYQYKAKDAGGHTVVGHLDADNERATAEALRDQGLWPLSIRRAARASAISPDAMAAPASVASAPSRTPGTWHAPVVPLKQLAVYFRQLSAAVHSGMPLARSLEVVRQQSRGTLARVSAEAAEAAHQGQKLSTVLEHHPRAFSALIVATVRAGEVGGTLDTALGRIADTLERQYALHQQIRRDTFFPKLTLGFGVFIVLVTQLILRTIGGPGAAVGQGFGSYLVPAVGCLILFYLGITALGRLGIRSRGLDQLKLSLPLLGRALKQLAVARFARAFAGLYRAGVALPETLAVAATAAANQVIAERLQAALPALQRGERLSVALARVRVLPEMALQMLSTGEETGNVDDMLDKVADYLEAEAETAIKALASAVGPVVLIGVAVLVFFEALSFYGGLLGRFSDLTSEP